jgi:hypothetical protein
VRFDDATFRGAASFARAIFKGPAQFRRIKFEKEAIFLEAKFGEQAHFHASTVKGGCFFTGASFGQLATLIGTVFASQSNQAVAWLNLAAPPRETNNHQPHYREPCLFDLGDSLNRLKFYTIFPQSSLAPRCCIQLRPTVVPSQTV